MRMFRLLTMAAVATVFAASAATASTKVKYACKGGTTLTVVFKKNAAQVSVPGAAPVTLPQGPSGDGFLYAKKSYSLRGVGNSVTWSTGRSKTLSCKARK